jgi:hypothetical protein
MTSSLRPTILSNERCLKSFPVSRADKRRLTRKDDLSVRRSAATSSVSLTVALTVNPSLSYLAGVSLFPSI